MFSTSDLTIFCLRRSQLLQATFVFYDGAMKQRRVTSP